MTLSNNAPLAQMRDVMDAVLAVFPALDRNLLLSRSRKRMIARPRQVAMALSRELCGASLPQIGRYYGGRDHTTALHGIRRIASLCQTDRDMDVLVEQLRGRVMAAIAPDQGDPQTHRARLRAEIERDPDLRPFIERAAAKTAAAAQAEAARRNPPCQA